MRQALTKRSDTSGISSPRHDGLTWVREHSAHELRANLDPSVDHTGYWRKNVKAKEGMSATLQRLLRCLSQSPFPAP
jgi:hypothetical protein